MKLFTALFVFLFSTTLMAATNIYELKMNFSIDGKNISSTTIIVEDGKIGTVVQENKKEKNFFEVVATEGEINGNKGILMNFKVGHILKDGSKKILFSPRLLSKNGQEASVTVGDEKTKEEMTLKVTAKRRKS